MICPGCGERVLVEYDPRILAFDIAAEKVVAEYVYRILGTSWDDVSKTPSLEEVVSDTDLQQTGIAVLPQTLIATFDSSQGFPQKIEGLTVLDGETLAIANDNDFGIGSFTDPQGACRLVDTSRKSEIRVIHLPASIK